MTQNAVSLYFDALAPARWVFSLEYLPSFAQRELLKA